MELNYGRNEEYCLHNKVVCDIKTCSGHNYGDYYSNISKCTMYVAMRLCNIVITIATSHAKESKNRKLIQYYHGHLNEE